MTGEGAIISCATPGASIGYRIIKEDQTDEKQKRVVESWDYGTIFHMVNNGDTIELSPSWKVYNGSPVKLEKGDRLLVNAMRIGYQPATNEINNYK